MKKDELNNLNINNSDGEFKAEEDSLKNIKEVEPIPEVENSNEEVFSSSENFEEEEEEKTSIDANNLTNGTDTATNAANAATSGASAAAGVVGSVVGVVAVSAVLVLNIVKLPVTPAVDVRLLAQSASSLSFSLNTNIENKSELFVSLKGLNYEVSLPFQEYIKFTDLSQNEVYTLSVYENDTSRYSSSFYTNDIEEIQTVFINVTSYVDDKLYFNFVDEMPGQKLYTVTCKNKAGNTIFTNDTSEPKEYVINDFKEDLAIYVYVDGVVSAAVQVYKPIYDYENIQWIWGEYGENITAIIPSLNETEDYYVKDIRNFEIERVDATCTTDGYVIRQAAFIGPDKNRYEAEKEFVIPALNHDFSEVTYTWSNDYQACRAESTCSHCGVKIEENVMTTVEEVSVEDNGLSYTKYTASFGTEPFGIRTHYEDLYYGRYPQSLETDDSITGQLDEYYGRPYTQNASGSSDDTSEIPYSEDYKWVSYDYYAAGEIKPFMYYIDVDFDEDGINDYRGVYFESYRPISTTDELGNSSYQYDNGFDTETTYWFKYEPIKWNVLEQKDNKLFIYTDLIIDSQSYYHELNENEFVHNGGTGFASNYELSDIRLWLNNTFYNTAFSDERSMVSTIVDNSLESTLDSMNPYVCENTIDKLFLLSRSEINDDMSASALKASGSDYAKSQGLYVALENNMGFYGLRTPYPSASYQVRYITNDGSTSYDSINKTSLGVRPGCWIIVE